MTSDIQTQIDRAKNIIRNSPRGPYKRIPSASTDHKMIGIPDNTAPGGDRAIASALIFAGDRDAEAMAAYIVGSADPHHGWNAMIDALIAARGAVAPVHVVNNSTCGHSTMLAASLDAAIQLRGRLVAAVNEEAEFVIPEAMFDSVIETAITRLEVLTRDRRRTLDLTATHGDLEHRLHFANEKIKRLEIQLRSSRTMEQLRRDEMQESRELGEAPRPPSYQYNYDAACPLTGVQVIAIIKQTITDTLFQSDAARGLADAPPPWLIAAVARGAAAGMDIARNNPLTFATARQVMRETLTKNEEKWLMYRRTIERLILANENSTPTLTASRIMAEIFGVEVGRLGSSDDGTTHALADRDVRACASTGQPSPMFDLQFVKDLTNNAIARLAAALQRAGVTLAGETPVYWKANGMHDIDTVIAKAIEVIETPSPLNSIPFERARQIMRGHFVADICDDVIAAGGVLNAYVANVAMLMHDRYGITDITTRTNAARDVMKLLFELPLADGPKLASLSRLYVESKDLRAGDAIISCDGVLWVDRTVLTGDANIIGEMVWIAYVPTGSPFQLPHSFQYDAKRTWLVERVLAPGTVSDAPIPESQPAPEPDSSPLDRDSIDADHRILIYAGGKMRVVPLPLAIAGTCSAMRQLAAAIADDGGLGCNGDGEDHDWIEVRAEAPSVGEIDPDSAQVPW